eukprot:1158365-Pelagomonas_calceolata.AAC.13
MCARKKELASSYGPVSHTKDCKWSVTGFPWHSPKNKPNQILMLSTFIDLRFKIDHQTHCKKGPNMHFMIAMASNISPKLPGSK